jgi:hypothetical protein
LQMSGAQRVGRSAYYKTRREAWHYLMG